MNTKRIKRTKYVEKDIIIISAENKLYIYLLENKAEWENHINALIKKHTLLSVNYSTITLEK